MAKHPKHLFVNTPAFAANLAQLHGADTHPYNRELAATAIYESCYPYVAQQGEMFADRANAVGIERSDLEQAAALKLWEFVNRPAPDKAIEPFTYVRLAYNVVRSEMLETCEAGSGDVVFDKPAEVLARAEERRVDKAHAVFTGSSHAKAILASTEESAALAWRTVAYEANARKPAIRLDDVVPPAELNTAVDEDAIMDGVFDTPTKGAAAIMHAPQLLPEDEVDARRQRDLVTNFARHYLPARHFEIICKRFGLDDAGNRCQTQQEIADAEGVSKERIKQIEENSISRLRARLGVNRQYSQAFMGILTKNE